jgi:hypothetical protein
MKNTRRSTVPLLAPDRLEQRLEHFMSEITAIEHPASTQATEPRESPQRRRSHRWPAVAGVGAIAAATAGAFLASSVLGGPSGQGPAAFAFQTISNDTISIRVVNSDVAAKEMTKQLHAQGLKNVRVRALPVLPQMVGHWTGMGGDGRSVPVADMIGRQMAGYTTTIEVPAHFDGDITFYVGRAPKPGEYANGGAINALAPSGVLHCLRLSGAEPDVALARLSAAGYIPHWIKGTLRDNGPKFQRAPVEPEPGSRVVYATVPAGSYVKWPADSKDVYLRTAQPGSLPYEQRIWEGYPLNQVTPGTPPKFSDCPATPK